MSAEEIRKLVETADVADDTNNDGPVEIVIRGRNADTILEALGLTRDKNYDPDKDESDKDDPDKDESDEPSLGKGLADKLFGIKP